MNKELNFLECWISVATDLFSQAMAGEPVLVVTQIEPMPQGSFGFSTTFEGDEEGRFSVVLDGALAEASLLGEGVDQKAAWEELLKGVTHTAARELRSRSGKNCEFGMFRPVPVESQVSNAFLLKSGERSWSSKSRVNCARINQPSSLSPLAAGVSTKKVRKFQG